MKRTVVTWAATALAVASLTLGNPGSAAPAFAETAGAIRPLGSTSAPRVRCFVLDEADWYIVTGQVSPYGGTWCSRR